MAADPAPPRATLNGTLASFRVESDTSPAYQQLASAIRAAIASGELGEGQRLPSELSIAQLVGVSRSTVREALRVLQESGFVGRVSPKILEVRGSTEDAAVRAVSTALQQRTVNLDALVEALTLVEPELSRLAATRRDETDLAHLREVLDLQEQSQQDFATWSRLDETFHVTIAEASRNAPLILTRVALGQVLVPAVLEFVDSERATETGLAFHRRLYQAVADQDAELAALCARRHVQDFGRALARSDR